MPYIDGLSNIPHAMRQHNQWMLTDNNKAPLAYDWGEHRIYQGSKNRQDQWLSFADAVRLADEFGLFIGYCPTERDPFTIIDLDHKPGKVYDADAESIKNGLFAHAAATTYVETSLSGMGAHIVVEGKLPQDFNAQSAGIECYGNKGFVLMTGRIVSANNALSNHQSSLDWLAQKYPNAVKDAEVNGLVLDWSKINEATPEEKALDDQFAEWVNQWETRDRVDGWLNYQGENMSGPDMKVMQLFVKFTRERANPDESAVRMFLRSPRAKFLNRKPDPQQYVMRTLLQAKAYIAADEQRLKDFDFGEGSRKLMEQYLAQMTQPESPAPSGPANSAVAPNLPAQQAPFSGFSWLTKSDLEKLPSLNWVIKGLFPAGGLGAIYGESGAGKSFVAIDMIAAIATGNKWFGLRTKQLPVSVFALEGEGGLKGRVKAWESVNDREYPHSVYFWDSARNGAFALRDADQRTDENRKRLIQLCADLKAHERMGGVVVIDTLNQASDGADENSSRDMGELIRAMKFIQRETGSLVLIVHHATKSKENQSMRGHSSLYGAMDGIMEVLREVKDSDGETIQGRRGWQAVKVKDGRDGYQRLFDMREVQVDMDEDGPVMSVAIEQVQEYLVDEQTGEAVRQDVGTIGKPKASGAGSSGKGGRSAKLGGSTQAPEVTRANGRDKPTWQPGEVPSRSGKEHAEREGKNGSNHQAILDAIAADTANTGGANIGKNGAPPGVHCAPRNSVLDLAVQIRNAPDPAQSKRNLNSAINAMLESGKLCGKTETKGLQWLWPSGKN